MSVHSTHASKESRDPFQLDRLAEELVIRESAHAVNQATGDDDLHEHNLPDYIPLSHNNVYLTAAEFDVQTFLLSRSYTSLPDLRTELREYLSELKQELVKLINDDYGAFISLSTDLKDEDYRLKKIKSPLSDFKLQVLQSRNELQTIQATIQEKLEHRATLREEKALLHLLLKLSESVTRLESLLLIVSEEQESIESPQGRPPGHLRIEDAPEDRSRGIIAKNLSRVAAEYVQLQYHASKARTERCRFVDEIQWRVDRIQSTVSSDLDHIFAATLIALTDGKGDGKATDVEKTKWISDLTECLKIYDILGLWRDAEGVLKREVVRGFVKKTIYPGALAAPHSPIVPHTPFPSVQAPQSFPATLLPPQTPYTPFATTRLSTAYSLGQSSSSLYAQLVQDTEDPLAKLYSQILRFVERDLSRIMEIAEKVSMRSLPPFHLDKASAPPFVQGCEVLDGNGFEIMANVIWEEFGRAITDELGGVIFSSGRPDEFRQHYTISQAFICSLESLAPSVHSIEVMRSHPIYFAFQQRWQFSVYFQMRWKDIIGRLEDSLAVTRIDPSFIKEKNTFATPQATSVWVALTACWSAEVFIPALSHRFWRLTLQILSRYKTWLDHTLSRSEAPSKNSAGMTSDKTLSSPSLSRASTPLPLSESIAVENTAIDDFILRQYAAIIIDIKVMRANMLTLWREQISVMLPEVSDDGGIDTQEIFQHALSTLTSLILPLSNQIVAILTKRCCDALLPVRSIPSQFRAMSNKRTPSEPSYFVSSILRPLKHFFGMEFNEGPGLLLSDEYLQAYSTEVFDSVTQRYIHYLSAMKKTEESLRRLKKGKKSTFSLFGHANQGKDDDDRDEERIRTQMIYDVEAFARDAESLGVVIKSSESYKALDDMIHVIRVSGFE